MYYEPGAGYITSLGVLGVIIGILWMIMICVCIGASFVSDAVMFIKCGEKPWKSLIPFYNKYIYFKLCWDYKMFIPYICTFAGVLISGIVWTASSSTSLLNFYYFSSADTVSVISLIFYILFFLAWMVFHIMISYHIAVSFEKGGGVTVGLVILPVLFRMIIAFGNAKYIKVKPVPTGSEAFLKGTTGQLYGVNITIAPGDPVVIGRDSAVASLILDKNVSNSKISKRHCKVEYDADKGVFFITDYSKNGTVLADGTKLIKEVRTAVKKNTEVILPNGDRFRLI